MFCGLEDEGTVVRFPAGARDVSLHQIPRQILGPLNVLFNRQREIFHRGSTGNCVLLTAYLVLYQG